MHDAVEKAGFPISVSPDTRHFDDDTLYVGHVDAEAVTIMKDGEVIEVVDGIKGRSHGVTMGSDGSIYVASTANRIVKKIVRR